MTAKPKLVCDPSVTVYKGYSLHKETEDYLAAHGLRNAVYSIDAEDARDGLFDDLVPCPFQESGPSKHQEVAEQEQLSDCNLSCILEFDGACKGNPGKSGAGVIIQRLDGSVIALLREGLGITTNNAAEYRALILGLDYAAKKGFKHIRAQGDSKLVLSGMPGDGADAMDTLNKSIKTLPDQMTSLAKDFKALKPLIRR
ncbi:ribonuclease H-like [Panicum virgatum]|uniref:ribonuclease H-like n=1 Tax=Panicum virgatum TaxID=38727 RepID=UPI0019D53E17|nr:ribonuclease H-like [Panicum virgatum]